MGLSCEHHEGHRLSASQNLAASLAKPGSNPFAWLHPLNRRAPVVGFDGIYRFPAQELKGLADRAKDQVKVLGRCGSGATLGATLGASIEATAAGQAAKSHVVIPHEHEVRTTLHVRVLAAHGLARTPEDLEDIDPYVVVRAGLEEQQTPAVINDPDPVWDIEFTCPADDVELLELEVLNANGQHSLGKSSLSIPDLARGVWHRRRLPLDKPPGELSVQVRRDVAVGQDTMLQLEPAQEEEQTFSAKGLQLSLPEDWESEESDDELVIHVEVDKVRPKTFAAPEDLFGDARLKVDPTIGPARMIQELASLTEAPARASGLASLREELYVESNDKGRRIQVEAEAASTALASALAKQKAMDKAAQEELRRVMKKLQELEAAAQAAPQAAPLAAPLAAPQAAPRGAPSLQPNTSAAFSQGESAGGEPAESSTSQGAVIAKPDPTPVSQSPLRSMVPKAKAELPPKPQDSQAVTKEVPAKSNSPQDTYSAALDNLQKVEAALDGFKKDASMKNFRMEVKKFINTRFGQISATWSRIQECTSALCTFLAKYSKEDESKRVFVEYAMAFRLVDDAEVSVRSQPRAAWSIAEVACRVFDKYPGVQELFRGLMCRACPYLRAESSAQVLQDMAQCRRPQEALNEMVDRMVSYQRLWLAIAAIQGELSIIWHWLACTLNQAPSTTRVAMIHAALDMVGADAQARYKKQFEKLVACISDRYMAEVSSLQANVKGEEADRLRASHSRLSRWIQDFKLRGRATYPDGRHVQARQESELNPHI
ncbi:unnamed protein product [Effrenium voratum]|nr:unnamed protein product [Effrenium voratum]